MIVDVIELAMLVLGLEVVPILAADEHAGIAVLQLEVVDALEYLREGLAFLEVQAAVVRGTRRCAPTTGGGNEVRISPTCCPTGTNRQLRIELPFHFT
ncbi:hypothetical protein D3C78_1793190 [compost metagenome]